MKDESIVIAFKLIAEAGDAKSSAMEAMYLAGDGSFTEAREALEKSGASLMAAHETQTDLLRDEVGGKGVAPTLMMVHAQDHLSGAILLRDLASLIIGLNEKVSALEGRIASGAAE